MEPRGLRPTPMLPRECRLGGLSAAATVSPLSARRKFARLQYEARCALYGLFVFFLCGKGLLFFCIGEGLTGVRVQFFCRFFCKRYRAIVYGVLILNQLYRRYRQYKLQQAKFEFYRTFQYNHRLNLQLFLQDSKVIITMKILISTLCRLYMQFS